MNVQRRECEGVNEIGIYVKCIVVRHVSGRFVCLSFVRLSVCLHISQWVVCLFSCLSVSLSLRLSRISAISLYSGSALSALVTPASGHVTVSLPFDYLHSKFLLLFTLFSYFILDISGTLKCAALTNCFFGMLSVCSLLFSVPPVGRL